jgi:hypothetical protein
MAKKNEMRRLKKIEDEQWKYIPGSNKKYQVSNYGRVKSFAVSVEGKVMKQGTIKGYKTICIPIDNKSKTLFVHKVTAEAFVPKKSKEQNTVIHLDWNSLNNHFKNLQWTTKADSLRRMMARLKEKNKDKPGHISHSKLKEQDVARIKMYLEKGVKQVIIAKMFCVSEMQITRIKRGENWSHVKPLKT